MIKYFTIALLLITFNSYAQYTISGKVTDSTDKKPIHSATVFLNRTGISAQTDEDGSFTLTDVPKGRYELFVSFIGFETHKVIIKVGGDINADISLAHKTEALKEVTIKAKPKLSPYYYSFRNELLGSSMFARQCVILNPNDIQFFDTDARGGFSAKSANFIEVENDALGYKIKFLLNYFIKDMNTSNVYFSGESYFEELKGTPKQQQEWQINRLQCYQGSVMQLLRSIISDSLKENGYKVKRARRQDNPYYNPNGLQVDQYDVENSMDFFDNSDNTLYDDKISTGPLHRKELLLTTSDKSLYAVVGVRDSTSNNSLYIEHTGNVVPVAGGKQVRVPWIWHSTVTFMTFNKPYMIFDNNGKVLNPRNVKYSGFFSEQTRMVTELPSNYKPM